MNISKNIQVFHNTLPKSASLIAVSKTFSANCVREAYNAGQRDFGENKVQELRKKSERLNDLPDIRWHFIGHLQSNKVKALLKVSKLYMVHSIDRSKIAYLLNKYLSYREQTLRVLVQVNTSGENSKYGCTPEQAESLVKDVANLSQLHLSGLMTIGKLGGDDKTARDCFSTLARLRDNLKAQKIENTNIQHLSMGMTSDYKIALQENSTLVRIGQAIFGQRDRPDQYYWPDER